MPPSVFPNPINIALYEPIEVFIAYSHRDEDLKDELYVHLANLTRQRKIYPWQDRAIEAGTDWAAEIKARLESAGIILLLITPRFIASEYCFDQEMQRAMARHAAGTARVIPIIMKPCDWQSTPFSHLQVLPKDGKPVTTWDNQDEALLDAVQGIRRVVETMAYTAVPHRTMPSGGSPRDLSRAPSVRTPVAVSPFITGTPIAQPSHFFGRQRILKRLFNLLKTHPLQNAAIIGQRRSGKTSLLNYLRTITTTPPAQLRPGQPNDWLPIGYTYRWVYVDFQDVRMAQQETLLRFLLASMQLPVPNPCDLEHFMDSVSGNVQTPTVILLDEVGVGLKRCPQLDDGFWESLRALASNQTDGNLAFVLATPERPGDLAYHTGHSSPFFNIFGYTTTLGPFSAAEARELMASSPIPFSAADVDWILEHSGGWPLLVQILCRERLFNLTEGDALDDWCEEGLEQMQPFVYLRSVKA